MKTNFNIIIFCALVCSSCSLGEMRPVNYVNPLMGTETLWDSVELGYRPTRRTWGAEVFPGAAMPNGMVQASPVTMFRSGAGYQYEDTLIYGFTHTNKGHWNLCHIPLLPVTGNFTADNYASHYSHDRETASAGYYQVFLDRYGINAELSVTLRCAFHRYTFKKGDRRQVLADLARSNEYVRGWKIDKCHDFAFCGYQETGEKMYFYAVSNSKITSLDSLKRSPIESGGANEGIRAASVVSFDDSDEPLELKIGFSFVSVENAKDNMSREIGCRDFKEVRGRVSCEWNKLLSQIRVFGGAPKQKTMFYSCLYRSMLWPALRSDCNGEFTDNSGNVVNKGFRYYTDPSFWDDYRNKLVLLGMLAPSVAADVINSITDRGSKSGFMPTFFHGDHASVFVAGTYLRGIEGFDVKKAYTLLLNNAMFESRSRPRLNDYMEKHFIPEPDIQNPRIETVAAAGVTKTLEYSYDDYAVMLLARALGDTQNADALERRTLYYRNMFDPQTQLMRGRLADGSWITPFDPCFPYYEYMYREANSWQSSFFAPHDIRGLIALYGGSENFEHKLDTLFTLPWRGYEAHNLSTFIGQYCHGNQPDHNYAHLYTLIGKQHKTQQLLDTLMNHFYGMGKHGLAYCGMDDAGEMSSWYVMNAIGLYTFSPADPEYLVSVPLFDRVEFTLGGNEKQFTIVNETKNRQITSVSVGGKVLEGYFVPHSDLKEGKEIVIQ